MDAGQVVYNASANADFYRAGYVADALAEVLPRDQRTRVDVS